MIATSPRISRGGVFVYNLAFVFVAVGIFETYLGTLPGGKFEGTYADRRTYFVEDADLGYAVAPREHIASSILKSAEGSIIYDARYSINRYGQRQTSLETVRPKEGKAIFFFGDSFTFGQGVNDQDTLPFQFHVISGIRTLNFGVHGYGAHQVLRQLEINRPRTIEPNDPLAIVYTLLPHHLVRAGGRAEWDQNGPRYELVDGTLKYLGPFAGAGLPVWERALAHHCRIYARFWKNKVRRITTNTDRERLLAIVQRIQQLSVSQYHAPLIVILWDVNKSAADSKWIRGKLQDTEIPTLVLSTSAPKLQSDIYYIPEDAHPTGKAYALVAEALSKFLVQHFPSIGALLQSRGGQ